MAFSTTIGDSQEASVQPIVAEVGQIGLVTLAQISDIDDPVNNTLVSGKKYGAMYVLINAAGASDIVIAQGSATNSKWNKVSDAGVAPVTPA